MAAELKRVGWTAQDLKRRRKGDGKKVRIAQRLRAETIMTLKWIAEELQMGAWTHVFGPATGWTPVQTLPQWMETVKGFSGVAQETGKRWYPGVGLR